jgi:hypothetical protein
MAGLDGGHNAHTQMCGHNDCDKNLSPQDSKVTRGCDSDDRRAGHGHLDSEKRLTKKL